MAYNASLNAVRSAKNDEFYTRYEDIEREMEAYLAYDPCLFRDKTVLCPCDDLGRSNFARYFSQNCSCGTLEKITDARSRESKIDAVELFRAS